MELWWRPILADEAQWLDGGRIALASTLKNRALTGEVPSIPRFFEVTRQ
jgi:hypothetical protein